MKLVLVIAVFCVVPCAFQDVWDNYDTWYDDFNNLESGELKDLTEDKVAPETVQENENKEFDSGHDYIDEQDYKDYEIEDNRDGVQTKFEKEEEPNQDKDLDENYDNVESAVKDFDVFQQKMNDDKFSEDSIDTILDDDNKSKMDLDVLPEELSNPNMPVDDDVPSVPLGTNSFQALLDDIDEEPVQDTPLKQEDHDADTGDEGIQLDIANIVNDFEPIDEDNDDEIKEDRDDVNDDVNSEINAQDGLLKLFEEALKEKEQNIPELEDSEADVEADMKSIIDETQKILEETDSEFDENNGDKDEQDNIKLPENKVESDIKSIRDETREILEETNYEFDENQDEAQLNAEESNPIVPELEIVEKNSVETDDIDEDSVDKVYGDINENLDELFDTLANNDDETDNAENKQAVEEVANADDGDLSNEDQDNDNDFDYEGEARVLKTRNDYYDYMMNNDFKNFSKIFEDEDEDADNIEKDSPTNIANEDNEESPIVYGNDALDAAAVVITNVTLSEENEAEVLEEKNAPVQEENLVSGEETVPVQVKNIVSDVQTTKLVDDLTSSELDELSEQFVMTHKSEITMERDVAPVHITLTADEPVVITSPNYPNAYPTDSAVIDWILEGLGTGIEVNITDLAINSAQGHFLMLKPGQSDASGDQGIIFAHRLNSERRYRFRDVNRIFIRFNPLGGMSFSRGFQLSARMIESPESDENTEDLPDAESLIPEPRETATLLLAGVNSTAFLEIRDEFRRLLADMATMYINANYIDPGMNTTAVVTQITRSYVCNVNWPGFENCIELTFGVPLIYEDEDAEPRLNQSDLVDMWASYSTRDPFAARLSRMGISDYSVPKDSYILTLWVMIGVGMLIAAALLAVALWRYSCYENYTRMQEFSDTDSFHDKKRGLDMYPTPHQTLPPLYTENDYKWADMAYNDSTRVDMGGFTNNTFTRDELSDDSEVEVAVPRDRSSFQPRDFNVV